MDQRKNKNNICPVKVKKKPVEFVDIITVLLYFALKKIP